MGMGKVGAGAASGATFPCPACAPLSFRAICGRCNVRRENAHPPVPHMCLGGGDKGGKGGEKWVKWPDFAFSPPRLLGSLWGSGSNRPRGMDFSSDPFEILWVCGGCGCAILVKRYTGKSVAVLAWGGGEGSCFLGAFPGCGSWGRAGLRWGCAPRVFVHWDCGPCAWGHFDTGLGSVGGREGCDMGVQRWPAWERGRCLAGACGVHFGAPGVFSAAY